MKLHHIRFGDGLPLLILHGLFGSSDNWQTLGKRFAQNRAVYLIDLRNHGQSPHDEELTYAAMAGDIQEFIIEQGLRDVTLLGHSMGGKVGMHLALTQPAVLCRLIVADILPKAYPPHHDHILAGLRAMDLSTLASRQEADDRLAPYVKSLVERQFLLKNLKRLPGHDQNQWAWKMNLPAIEKNIQNILGRTPEGVYLGDTLFIMGRRSEYYAPGDEAIVAPYFPHAAWAWLDAGHWLHTEQPESFFDAVLQFLAKT